MRLSFVNSFLSIWKLDTVDLPDFTLITGRNGSGKTHLLKALVSGAIKTDEAPNQSPANPTDVRYFDWSNLVPQDVGAFSSDALRNEKLSLYQQLNNAISTRNAWEPVRNTLRNKAFVSGRDISDPSRIVSLGVDDLKKEFGSEIDANAFHAELTAALVACEAQIAPFIQPDPKTELASIAASIKKPLLALSEHDVVSSNFASWGQNAIFQHAFNRLFVAFRDAKLSNDLIEFQNSKGYTSEIFLDPSAFTEAYGPPPWDFVNRTLADANLDFRINQPDLFRNTPYLPRLMKISSGIPVPFQDLSSGEKVLISLVFCVYYANDTRQRTNYPKVILLDEVDAPLHPSMCKNLIGSIIKTLVGGFGIKVIATTHSPTTLALAPEESLYLMDGSLGRLSKISKTEGLNILTEGVPTLSLSFEGRRQVLVESPADAEIYDLLYQIAKPNLLNERSLQFVATGTGSTNSGCAIVKQVVSDLANSGNNSVFGLLDWDGVNDPTERIVVLAYRKKNGLENLMFDPLLIALVICREFADKKALLGIPQALKYLDMCRTTDIK